MHLTFTRAGVARLSALLAGLVLTGVLAASAPAGISPGHGQLRQLHANANQSGNWFGYNQGTLEKNNTMFSAITGDWTVPTATRHTAGQDEYSSDWIGIGGGCVDAGCNVGDNTLIQTGTESDVSSKGKASYSAWSEVIPGPSLTISMTVAAGDRMHASVAETVANSNVWVITLKDVTRNETFTQFPDVRRDSAHRLEGEGDRDAVGARSRPRRLQRLHVGDDVLGAELVLAPSSERKAPLRRGFSILPIGRA